jgi:tRNA 2-thiocytidine biosynthesis protein TtcA
MLREWERRFPGRIESIFGALTNVVPSHLLDRHLFDFGAAGSPASAVKARHLIDSEEYFSEFGTVAASP